MNKKNKQFVPLCYLAAVIIFFAIVFVMVNDSWQRYTEIKESSQRYSNELENQKQRYEKEKEKRSQEELQLKSIKQVYQTNYDSTSDDNLAMFGTMFDDIIKKAQYNGLFIRSIEYDMKPDSDAIYNNFSNQYYAYELKFFLIGKYPQLRAFMNDITNNFQYLLSVSKLNVTAFSGDTDYILINIGITLYSKKPINEED